MKSLRRAQNERGSSWFVIGLGNPGAAYTYTRHNSGARVVETMREHLGQAAFRHTKALQARVSKGKIILAIPETFMNTSGDAVSALVRHFHTPIECLLLVHDDKDLAFGRLKLERGRGAAGHHGVDSVIGALNSKAFWRLRIGVGTPPPNMSTDMFVLEPFSPEEESALISRIVPNAVSLLVEHVSEEKRTPRA